MQRQDEVKDKDLEGCTFKPELVTHHSTDKRTLDQFLGDQKRFQEKVHKKIEDAKEQNSQQEQSIMSPHIDETSARIVEEKMGDRKNKTTYDRLYDLNKERQEKLRVKQNEQKFEFSKADQSTAQPRREGLDQTLYDDAQRRKVDNEKKKQELDKIRDKPKVDYFHNDNSDKYVAKRVERELQQLEQDFATEDAAANNEEEPNEREQTKLLTQEQVQKVLIAMGFLPFNRQIEEVD